MVQNHENRLVPECVYSYLFWYLCNTLQAGFECYVYIYINLSMWEKLCGVNWCFLDLSLLLYFPLFPSLPLSCLSFYLSSISGKKEAKSEYYPSVKDHQVYLGNREVKK